MISEETFTVALLKPQLIKRRLELSPLALEGGGARFQSLGDVVALHEVVRVVAQIVVIIAFLVLFFLNWRKEGTIGSQAVLEGQNELALTRILLRSGRPVCQVLVPFVDGVVLVVGVRVVIGGGVGVASVVLFSIVSEIFMISSYSAFCLA